MKDNEFAEFLRQWRKKCYFDKSNSAAYMEEHFSNYDGKHEFSEDQLIKIVGFLLGVEQKNVILTLGNTKLLPETYLIFAQIVDRIAEIKVSYQLSEQDFANAKKYSPTITLKDDVISTDANIVLNVDNQHVVLNS